MVLCPDKLIKHRDILSTLNLSHFIGSIIFEMRARRVRPEVVNWRQLSFRLEN